MVKRTGITGNNKIFPKTKNFLSALGRPLFWLIFLSGYGLLATFVFGKYLWSKLPTLKPKIPKFSHLPKIKLTLPRLRLWQPKKPKHSYLIFIVMVSSVFIWITYWFVFADLPNPNTLVTRKQVVTTKIFDRHDQLLYKIYRQQNRSLVKLEEIPLELIQATLAIEDAEFYHHPGFSLKGIFRAMISNLKSKQLYGGSTITQQLVKNTLLSPERTLRRKLKEFVLAVWVERKFSKDEILQMYFNEVGYGGAAYGVEEASQMYFGKSVRDLDLAEAALLAGLPASPTTYSPFGAHPEMAKERQKLVLQRMLQEKMIDPQQATTAQTKTLKMASQRTDIQAPHFVMYVKELLVQRYGQQMVEEGGLHVTTSLDLTAQENSEAVLTEEIAKLKPLNVTNGAVLATNPKNGEILAMVGSVDYFNQENDGNVNVALRPRQPGSAIKPILYSLALENGFTAATIIPDTPITYQLPGQPPYSPRNYDNRFHGQVTLRTALASSYNVPAVKILSAIGVNQMVARGRAMGITSWENPSRFGLSLTLGGGEVKMIDMAVVYGTLANGGQKIELNPILEVKDYQGKVLKKNGQGWFSSFKEENSKEEIKNTIVNPGAAFILSDIMSDNRARTPAFGPNSILKIESHPHVAVKTGTTQNLRDNWTIGYTPERLVAVWVGNNNNQPMSRIASGVTGASPIWQQIMTRLLANQTDREFSQPENIVKVEICPRSGTLPCRSCGGYQEFFLNGTQPSVRCRDQIINDNTQSSLQPESIINSASTTAPETKTKPPKNNIKPPSVFRLINQSKIKPTE